MGSFFNRGSPDRPNIWLKFMDLDGKEKRVGFGKVNPKGLTKREVRARQKELEKQAARRLHEISLNIAAGRSGLDDGLPEPVELPVFEEEALTWARKRKETHRSGGHDLQRMKKHLLPLFKGKRLDEITTGQVRRLIDVKRKKLAPSTVERLLALLSRFFNDMAERDLPVTNPVAALDRATRRRVRSTHDPKDTPFLRTKEEIRAVYLALPVHVRPVFAVGVFAGLRKNEILGLRWEDIDLERRVINLRRQKVHGKNETGPLKSGKSRVVPILDTLLPVLEAWKLRCPSKELCFPSRIGTMMDDHTLNKQLNKAFKELDGVERVTWHQATRHTFASHWVMDGRPIEKLKEVLGHSSVTVTERYAHLRPDAYNAEDLAAVSVDLSEGEVVDLPRLKGQAQKARPGYKFGYSSQGQKKDEAVSA